MNKKEDRPCISYFKSNDSLASLLARDLLFEVYNGKRLCYALYFTDERGAGYLERCWNDDGFVVFLA